MAEANQCFTCRKPIGVMHCIGCDGYFCTKDFRGHRKILSTAMEQLVEERNKLQEKINKATKSNNSINPLIEEINVWEKITIEKVRQTAEQARQQANQLLNSKSMNNTNEFKSFSDKLADLKETENYVEHDLTKLKQTIHQFNVDLTQLSQATIIELNREESERIKWNRMIYVQEKSVEVERQQTPQRKIESLQVTKPLPRSKLRCGGRACAQCGKCSDLYYDKDKKDYVSRDGVTCNRTMHFQIFDAAFTIAVGVCRCN
ncbi:unnamed protein product [Adineta steineri]|uniref:B box-type domain-containing protein n=1 Tax=Adineta steineri TaxID=433720 RepID=A0A819XLX9_9BILA|nr:unnamed protein product [Adineta steineri]CAF1087775.1 unnamed protein product [Adineta steineri]CAF3650445.1 unnamed protein product [Adineta steineri]CAF4144631.1 unnamed protein product [Adineta steineri]